MDLYFSNYQGLVTLQYKNNKQARKIAICSKCTGIIGVSGKNLACGSDYSPSSSLSSELTSPGSKF